MSAGSASVATGGYTPPYATAAGTGVSVTASVATTTSTAGTTRQSLGNSGYDSSSFKSYFTIPYLDAHVSSIPTYRYAYILWFLIAAIVVVWSIMTQFNRLGRGSALGALTRKWMIRRVTIAGRKPRPDKRTGVTPSRRRTIWASPTIAQMLAVLALIGAAVCLCIIGNDYISPTTCTFGGRCDWQSVGTSTGPPQTTYRARLRREAMLAESLSEQVGFEQSAAWGEPEDAPWDELAPTKTRRNLNIDGWAPFNDPLLAAPNTDVAASWWTSSNRIGMISYAMLPFIVTLAVKQWPFNIWATPFLTNYHFDKTAILHRWAGRVIWLFSTAHTATWSVQLVIDKDPYGRSVYIPVLSYWRFIAGIAAYVFLTIIVLFSFAPLRNRFYEFFYWSHVALVILFLATCIMHFRPLMYWPIAAFAIWGAERLTRFILVLWINKVGGVKTNSTLKARHGNSFEVIGVEKKQRYSVPDSQSFPPVLNRFDDMEGGAIPRHRDNYFNFGPGQDRTYLNRHGFSSPPPRSPGLPPTPPSKSPMLQAGMTFDSVATSAQTSAPLPPPGYALTQLLPGRTVRLTLHTPRPVRWTPGQHVLLSIPSIKLADSHPYTIMSVDERNKSIVPLSGAANLRTHGSEIVLLVRAQRGFSKTLWDKVVAQRRANEAATRAAGGVLLRAFVSWPMGSSCRVSWASYDSFLVICGGTGITYGMSVLEYLCRRMARRDGLVRNGSQADSKAFRGSRVRFVWILREFAHLAWISPTLRRCLDLVGEDQLQVDLFVSHDASMPRLPRRLPHSNSLMADQTFNESFDEGSGNLAPPRPAFAKSHQSRQSLDSAMSDNEDDSPDAVYDLYHAMDEQYESVTDLVIFDGEEDVQTTGDADLSTRLRQEGKVRRAKSRRVARSKSRPSAASPRGQSPTSERTPTHADRLPVYNDRSPAYSDDKLAYRDGVSPAQEGHQLLHGPHTPATPRQPSGRSPYGPVSANNSSFFEVGLRGDGESEVYSIGGGSSVHRLLNASGSQTVYRDDVDDIQLDVTDQDQEDLNAVAELARAGHPRLDQILDSEVERSRGTTLVACCGPTSLNTIVRHLVSSRIDVKRILHGDKRGQVSLTCEDFSF